jgi:hypothetical protein
MLALDHPMERKDDFENMHDLLQEWQKHRVSTFSVRKSRKTEQMTGGGRLPHSNTARAEIDVLAAIKGGGSYGAFSTLSVDEKNT